MCLLTAPICLPFVCHLFALVFLTHDQLLQVGEEIHNVPPCMGEHCFAFCMQDILLVEVDAVRPYLPSRIFVRDSNRWCAASEVFRRNNYMFAYHYSF